MATADNNSMTRFYVPEIHDIHPGMQERLDDLLDVWPDEARRCLALLVVPNWHGRFQLEQAPRFGERIARLPGEKVLHGWTHSLGPDWWNWLMYAHDNRSEFARLDGAQAKHRLSAGIDAFASQFGFRPRWFCAPRWQQSAAATTALQDAGIAGYMLRGSLQLFSGAGVQIPALNFDEGERKLRSAIMRHLRETTIARQFAHRRPFRIALHPGDVGDGQAWRQVRRVIARLAGEGWTPLSPDEAVARMAGRPTADLAQAAASS